MKGKSKESPEGVRQNLKPGDVRVVNINGRPVTLVIGKEYKFTFKSGCGPVPYEPEQTKEAEGEPKRRTPKPNTKTSKRKPAAEQIAVAKNMIAAADAAYDAAIERGYSLTDEELKALGYVADEGGTWGLDIPDSVIAALWEEQKQKNG